MFTLLESCTVHILNLFYGAQLTRNHTNNESQDDLVQCNGSSVSFIKPFGYLMQEPLTYAAA